MEITAIKIEDCELTSTGAQVVKAIRAFLGRLKFVLLHKNIEAGDEEAIGVKLWNRPISAMPLELSTLHGAPDFLYCKMELNPPVYWGGAAYRYGFCALYRQSVPNSPWELNQYIVFATNPDYFLHLTRGEQDELFKL